jgi:competence protein ComEA
MMKLVKSLFLSVVLLFGASVAYAADKLDINTATVTQLQTIKGIGPKLASTIVKYRTEHHGFKSVEELKSVKGIGAKNYQHFKDHLMVASRAPKANK